MLEVTAEPNTGVRRDFLTRFQRGNQAAKVHGLRSGTKREAGKQDRRTARLLRRYLSFRADEGRPIAAGQVPLARKFCEAEIRGRDLWAALTRDPKNEKLHGMWISTSRLQTLLAAQLGETATASNGHRPEPEGLAFQLARHRLLKSAKGVES